MTEHESLHGRGVPVGRPAEGDRRRRVVVGVDGSAGSRTALVYAWTAAAASDADLEVVGAYSVDAYWMDADVYDPLIGDGIRTNAEQTVARLIKEVRDDPAVQAVPTVPVRTDVVAGPAASVLIDRSEDADLLVVGSRRRGGVRSALLGSVALHCVTHARCPVVVVHPTTAESSGPARVVVGVDGSERSRTTLVHAMAEARRLGADVEVVTAYAPADTWTDMASTLFPPADEIRAKVERRTQDLVTDVLDLLLAGDIPGPSLQITVVEGPAHEVLVSQARGAALLVVGSTGRGELRGLLLGSVALYCAMHAPCPVMVVHPRIGRAAEPSERPGLATAR